MKHKAEFLIVLIVLVIMLLIVCTRLYTHRKISKEEVITPEYLSINGWKDCYKTKESQS